MCNTLYYLFKWYVLNVFDNLIFFFTPHKWYFHKAFTVILFLGIFPRVCLTWYQWQSFPYRQRMKAFNLRVFYSPLEPWQVFRSRCHWAGSGAQWVIGQTDRHSAGEVVSGGKGLWEKKWEGSKVEKRVLMLNTIKAEIFMGIKFHWFVVWNGFIGIWFQCIKRIRLQSI